MQRMDKNEVITLSSDDEIENNKHQKHQKHSGPTMCKKESKNNLMSFSQILKNICEMSQSPKKNITNIVEREPCIAQDVSTKTNKLEPPEVVDLVEIGTEGISVLSEIIKNGKMAGLTSLEKNINNNKIDDVQKSSKSPVDISEIIDTGKTPLNVSNETSKSDSLKTTVKGLKNSGSNFEISLLGIDANTTKDSFFNEFVVLCASLEPIPTDKARLEKKLYKRYNEANPEYLKTQKFKSLIEKCKNKINTNNLYLLAKEVCDELYSQKEIKLEAHNVDSKMNNNDEKNIDFFCSSNHSRKNRKIIKKIVKQLDRLGNKIHQLEEAEVDLSDEEESSYVQLQRYRYRFCLIYNKLCKYTNEVPDANRVYNRKICFSGSKYPEINKCIEKWLNKTKRFPDFTDILKLLENQSSSLGMPSDRESIRTIASEIFQQVGVMLQQRRKYDLWDSFCGYLDETQDPALSDPELDNNLKKNFEIRIAKEQEIMTHYSKMQEKQRLKAEEVPEDEALNSPNESDNEDDREIEEIENSINKKMDAIIMKEETLFENSNKHDTEKAKCIEICDSATEEAESTDGSKVSKQSKNDFKNCKSLKWRNEKSAVAGEVSKKNLTQSGEVYLVYEENNHDTKKTAISNESVMQKQSYTIEKDGFCQKAYIEESQETPKNCVESSDATNLSSKNISNEMKSPLKRNKIIADEDKAIENFTKRPKLDSDFEVRFCRVEYNFKNFCKVDYDKDLTGKIKKESSFLDLNNFDCFLKRHNLKTKNWKYKIPTFYYYVTKDCKKIVDKNRLRNNKSVRFMVKTCALSNDESTGKNKRNRGEKSKPKNINSNVGNQEHNVFGYSSGQGNGRRRDDNDNDKNKKHQRVDKDEDEREEEEENEDETLQEEDSTISAEKITPLLVKKKSKISSSKIAPNKKCQLKKKLVENAKSPRTKRRRWRRRTSLVTAETPVEGEVVRAEVTLNEEVVFLGQCKQYGQCFSDLKKPARSINENHVRRPTKPKRGLSTEPSDEERVKKFLMNSPPSVSIIPPKSLSLTKLPSKETLQALATLKKLKGISTTRVIKKINDEVAVTADNKNSEKSEGLTNLPEKKKTMNGIKKLINLPTLCTTQDISIMAPKVIEGENHSPKVQSARLKKKITPETSNIKISSVWGNCNNSFEENEGSLPGCSSSLNSDKLHKKRDKAMSSKKSIEYVILD